MNYAFIDANDIVVNVISGALTLDQRQLLLADYRVLFGAVQIVAVDDGVGVWIGGLYDAISGAFTPPPTPEPEPIVVETPIEVIEEIIPE